MHSDERRNPGQIDQLQVAELLSDGESFLIKYRGLQERSRSSKQRVTHLENELKQLKKELKNSKKAEMARIDASLDAYRKQNQQLKDDLARVRGSRSMKVGRVVLSPATFLKKLFRGDFKRQPEQSTALPEPRPRPEIEKATSTSPSPTQVPTKSEASTTPVSQRSLDTLFEDFYSEKSPTVLSHLVNRLWFTHGEITRTATLLLENADISTKALDKYRELFSRILGVHRSIISETPIPPRSEGIAYTPEKGRVVYCAHSTPIYNSNGYSTRTRGVAAGLRSAGADVVVLSRAGYPWDTKVDIEKPSVERSVSELDGVSYVHVPGPNLNREPIDHYILAAADVIVRECKIQRPEVIQAASNFRTALPALIAARRLGVPFVYEVRGLWEYTEASGRENWESTERFKFMASMEALVAKEADHVLAITRQVAAVLTERGVAGDKISLAPNAVDTSQFLPFLKDNEYAKKRRIRTDVPVIGFAGSIVPYEGLDTLLEASALLTERGVEHQVVIAGSGSAHDSLRTLRDEKRIAGTMFLGRLPVAEMPRLLSTFDIVPCPRKSQAVTELVSPLKPLEAFSAGKAVVLSDVAPHVDLAGENEDRALLFESGNAEDLANALERLISAPQLRQDMGRRARLWTIDERHWTHIGAVMRNAHHNAQTFHADHAHRSRELSSFRVGIIADEFTSSTLADTFTTVPINRNRWASQVREENLDFVFVESAWNGNQGQWHRGVGYYGEEESNDIRGLLDLCRSMGIPTIFWNKEDPIHFQRFRRIAALCDHVFTTDANMISQYLSTENVRSLTASSLPFYAQPKIHNPLPGALPCDPTVSYAGTYYGDRYKERSRELYRMLKTAEPFGLTIYDRQLAYPDSPYHFPNDLKHHVRGVLPYDQVIDSYKAHAANINVNSVSTSPTMFSRRVVEIAASGGLVLSGPGRGVVETFGGLIPASNDNSTWRAFLHAWTTSGVERVKEAWLQMRAVYRSHTVDTAMTILARTAGFAVRPPKLDSYSLRVEGDLEALLPSVIAQSIQPLEVFVNDEEKAKLLLSDTGISVKNAEDVTGTAADWVGLVQNKLGRTHFEDLLLTTRFGDFNRIVAREATVNDIDIPLASQFDTTAASTGLVRRDLLQSSHGFERALVARSVNGIELILPPASSIGVQKKRTIHSVTPESARTIVVAGHDLKFAAGIMEKLQADGHTVLVDQWQSHSQHDLEHSKALLNEADEVFCEWGLGNAVWYSQNVSPHQRLTVRIHSQELRGPYLRRIKAQNVDSFIFVGEFIRQSAIESHGIPANKSIVIPNLVDVSSLARPKTANAKFNIGLVGIVPRSKRLDLAIDLMSQLLLKDDRYRLFIKGKLPSEYPWMKNRPDELEFYEQQYRRIEEMNEQYPGAITFDGYGDDIPEWFQKIGIALSVSDFESFHFTIADGVASGALPVSLAWPGSDLLYPREWLFESVQDIAEYLVNNDSPKVDLGNFLDFDIATAGDKLKKEILGR